MKYRSIKSLAFLMFGMVTVYFICTEAVYSVSEQDRGVVLRNGKFLTVSQPGLGWKIPFADKVTPLSMQNNLIYWQVFQARTEDLDVMDLELSVVWRVAPDETLNMYKDYTTLENVENILLIPKVTEQARLIISRYTTEQALKKREAFLRSFPRLSKRPLSAR
ncbi:MULTISPECIES: SPFH domain-containing protein [Pseudomonas]|uniref:SPFH domain-containing protein n=1 Tax=Pseudomonas TaxID=286 RepID=UPI001BE9D830|nr:MULTISPECIES: SPFH domain-containing protein [Pseudomonas]MBT2339078.1 SPFH domain-containing protein [Pseudomonas fluorescens]MCD4528176.1 SPFH domain-containing protein [Pseudomonas sp. C3-2018]